MWSRSAVHAVCPNADLIDVTKFGLEYNIPGSILPYGVRTFLELLDSFIVLEGIDGSGTTTQASILTERLDSAGFATRLTSEPTHGPIGQLIRRVLSGELRMTPESLAMLYAADRHQHLYEPDEGIVAALNQGPVVCDRYLFSSLAYQAVECDFSRVWELNQHFPLPRQLIYVDLPPEQSAIRRKDRTSAEIFETLQFQRSAYELYRSTLEQFSDMGMEIHIVDGSASQQDISEQIWKQLDMTPIK